MERKMRMLNIDSNTLTPNYVNHDAKHHFYIKGVIVRQATTSLLTPSSIRFSNRVKYNEHKQLDKLEPLFSHRTAPEEGNLLQSAFPTD